MKKSIKSLIAKMGLEPLFKNFNSLCIPWVLWQAVQQSGAIITESRLPVLFLINLWYGDKASAGGPQGQWGLIE